MVSGIWFRTAGGRADIMGIAVDRLVIVLDSPDQIAFASAGDPAIVEGYRNVRIESDRLIVVRNSAIKIPLHRIREATIHERLAEVRVQPNCPIVVFAGRIDLTFRP